MKRRSVGRSDPVRRSSRLQNSDSFHVGSLRKQIERAHRLDDVVDIEPLQVARERRRVTGDVYELGDRLRCEPQRDVPVQSGAGRIDDVDVREIRLSSLGDIIGMVTQETYLFHTSIRQNLLYGKPDATQGQLEAAARAAFIHDRIAEMPEGYDTVVGERGYRMSGGEKQRLAIARVFLKNPAIIILDEATAHLDSESESLIQRALAAALEHRTSIVIAHRLSTIVEADEIFVVDGGKIVERGTHSELVGAGGTYGELYETQFSRVTL